MYLHFDTFEPLPTPQETRTAWMLADLRAATRARRLERRRARRGRLLAIVNAPREQSRACGVLREYGGMM